MSTKTRGRFVWFDLVTQDVELALRFYGELFGWKHEHVDMGSGMICTLLKLGDEQIGGMMKAEGPPAWNVYFTTHDTDATADLVHELGGKTIRAPRDIPNVGRFAAFIDPRGTAFSVLAPLNEKPDSTQIKSGDFCWPEANVDEPTAVSGFYIKLFGWQVTHREFEGFGAYHEYSRDGGKPAAGLQKKPGSFPNMWLDYIKVDDCDEALLRAERLGGEVLAPTTKLANVGSFAVLQDPTGAVFGILESG